MSGNQRRRRTHRNRLAIAALTAVASAAHAITASANPVDQRAAEISGPPSDRAWVRIESDRAATVVSFIRTSDGVEHRCATPCAFDADAETLLAELGNHVDRDSAHRIRVPPHGLVVFRVVHPTRAPHVVSTALVAQAVFFAGVGLACMLEAMLFTGAAAAPSGYMQRWNDAGMVVFGAALLSLGISIPLAMQDTTPRIIDGRAIARSSIGAARVGAMASTAGGFVTISAAF